MLKRIEGFCYTEVNNQIFEQIKLDNKRSFLFVFKSNIQTIEHYNDIKFNVNFNIV